MTNHRVKVILEEIEPLISNLRTKSIINGVISALEEDGLTELMICMAELAMEQFVRMRRENAERN